MSDADLVERRREGLPAFWRRCLDRAPHTRERARRCGAGPASLPPAARLRIVAARSVRTRPVVGSNWLAAGDAAGSFDPLSAQGILKALAGASLAARAVAAALRGDAAGLAEYAVALDRGYDDYLRARRDYYGMERRWPGSLFWRRRVVAPGD
jgi:flavin-dependent dehydrogenase